MPLRNLHVRLLNFLQTKLLTSISKVGHWNNLHCTSHSPEETVYDIVNCGPRRRFVVFGKQPFVVSNCVQSTGHDIHMLGLVILRRLLFERGLEYTWVIADFHDEAILEVPKGTEKEVIQCFYDMEKELNAQLNSYVPIKIDPAVGVSLADFKVEG